MTSSSSSINPLFFNTRGKTDEMIDEDHLNKDIRIDKDGIWYYKNSPIQRKELVSLFSSILKKEENAYWLITPGERSKIDVEDTPFMAVELFVKGVGKNQTIELRTNVDERFFICLVNPLIVTTNTKTGEPSPYVIVRDNLEAKLTRSAFYQLVELGTERFISRKKILGVWSCNQFFPIGDL